LHTLTKETQQNTEKARYYSNVVDSIVKNYIDCTLKRVIRDFSRHCCLAEDHSFVFMN